MNANKMDFGTVGVDRIFEEITASMPDFGEHNEIWKARSDGMLRVALSALVDLRDGGFMTLDPKSLLDGMSLECFVRMEEDVRLSPASRAGIKRYLDELPGYRVGSSIADEHHRYLLMCFLGLGEME